MLATRRFPSLKHVLTVGGSSALLAGVLALPFVLVAVAFPALALGLLILAGGLGLGLLPVLAAGAEAMALGAESLANQRRRHHLHRDERRAGTLALTEAASGALSSAPDSSSARVAMSRRVGSSRGASLR